MSISPFLTSHIRCLLFNLTLNVAAVDNDDGIVNERTFAVVKQNKFSMFHPREFVDQRIWRVDEKEGGVKVAVWPVEGSETVDYGELFGNKIRCFSKAIFHAKDVEDRIGIGLNQVRM